MILVRIKHVNYNGTFQKDKYWFKSNDDLKCNDYVDCDTKFGCVKGIVCDIYKTIDELIESHMVVNFTDLKEVCKSTGIGDNTIIFKEYFKEKNCQKLSEVKDNEN